MPIDSSAFLIFFYHFFKRKPKIATKPQLVTVWKRNYSSNWMIIIVDLHSQLQFQNAKHNGSTAKILQWTKTF